MIIDSKNPEISIIMATYNRSHLIQETLNSIVNQSFRDWECLIVDDGSNDDTFSVIKSLLDSDQRFKYYKREVKYKKGLPGSRNMGLDLAKGKYIQFFDDDDIIHPENLKTSLNLLKDSGFYFCRYQKKPFTGKWKNIEFGRTEQVEKIPFSLKNIEDMITGRIPFASCTLLWYKQCFEEVRFNEDLMYGEEWECYTRILTKGFSGVSINKILYYNRKHSQSNTGEYWAKNTIRRKSKIKAAILIIEELRRNNLISPKIFKYFMQLGFFLKSQAIINKVLICGEAGLITRIKYNMGFYIYPLLRPIFIIKGKIRKLIFSPES
ncbi:glycosyltransferase family 2 protein [Salegentibacter sp. F14]